MSARSLHEIATGIQAKARRTFQPVRRNSFNVGEREERFYRPVNQAEVSARLTAAETYNRKGKQPGKRNGPLGHVGIEVLRQLYWMRDKKTGRLDPAIDTLAKAVRRARSAVIRALAALRLHGFIDWIRRTEPTGNDGAGPQVRQVSNAYRLDLPAKARALVSRILRKPPQPVDDAERRADAAAEAETMLESLPRREEMALRFDDPALAATFARFGERLDDLSASPLSGQNPCEVDHKE